MGMGVAVGGRGVGAGRLVGGGAAGCKGVGWVVGGTSGEAAIVG
jgi:hypothetical protein